MCLKGTVASTFLMAAGGILRWHKDAELRTRFDAVLEGVVAAADRTSGFAAAFAPNETMYRENPSYVTSWLIHGLLEASVVERVPATGVGVGVGNVSRGGALQTARGMIDWFNSPKENFLLPEFTPPDRTFEADLPPVYGANQGHQIYLESQGIIHHTRMATSKLGKLRDIVAVKALYQEDEWLSQLAARNTRGIWQKNWFPHKCDFTLFHPAPKYYPLASVCVRCRLAAAHGSALCVW